MLKIRSAIVVGISLAVSGLSLLAQTNTSVGTDGSGPVYSLDQFGPCKSPADAEATYQKASKDIIAAGQKEEAKVLVKAVKLYLGKQLDVYWGVVREV